MSATAHRRGRRCRSRAFRAARSSRSRRSPTSDEAGDFGVRDATAEDARRIAHVRRQSWVAAYAHIFTHDQLASISEDEDTERWSRFLLAPPPRSGSLVAVQGAKVVGFSSYGGAREEEGVGELFTIYVLPESWGLGVGRALMRETLVRLRRHDYTEAVLWVLEDNPRTRRFYERAAWHADGGAIDGEWLGTVVGEVRYRIDLESAVERRERPE